MAQAQRQPVKRTFKTPEGRFQLGTERQNGCSFSSLRPTKLSFASVLDGRDAGHYVIFNVQECIHICHYNHTDKVARCSACSSSSLSRQRLLFSKRLRGSGDAAQIPKRTISFGVSPSGAAIMPTCHAHTAALDSVDLLIGLSTGDGAPPRPHACQPTRCPGRC